MSNFYEYPDYLAHYGVKGMKWGVRHDNRTGARKLYRQTSKNLFTDGKTWYAGVGTEQTRKGTRNTSAIGVFDGKGETKKEAIKNAERAMVRYLNKQSKENQLRYESKTTDKVRERVAKDVTKEYEKAKKADQVLNESYKKAISMYGPNSDAARKLMTYSTLAKQDLVEKGQNYIEFVLTKPKYL